MKETALLLKALRFAANKHGEQRRKDEDPSPYINHPIEVAEILANACGVTDLPTLLAAVPHDTVEDTETTFEELEGVNGPWKGGGNISFWRKKPSKGAGVPMLP